MFLKIWGVQASLPETSPFLASQMAVMSSSFSIFILLGIYNFGCCMHEATCTTLLCRLLL